MWASDAASSIVTSALLGAIAAAFALFSKLEAYASPVVSRSCPKSAMASLSACSAAAKSPSWVCAAPTVARAAASPDVLESSLKVAKAALADFKPSSADLPPWQSSELAVATDAAASPARSLRSRNKSPALRHAFNASCVAVSTDPNIKVAAASAFFWPFTRSSTSFARFDALAGFPRRMSTSNATLKAAACPSLFLSALNIVAASVDASKHDCGSSFTNCARAMASLAPASALLSPMEFDNLANSAAARKA
mmetsp:Transcript_40732/g.122997  ORF Transcript_40732/g.122997 Transcript_40732/m.122997 type:complete len:252 (+) Transcript_40732:660-1415(+)